MSDPDASVNLIGLARRLAAFESHLEWSVSMFSSSRYDCDPALASSYLHLIGRLEEIGGDAVTAALAEAIIIFDSAERRNRETDERERQQREDDYAEAVRRHRIAINAECPYCGAQPGATCRTAGPTAHGSYPKGIHDHAGRYRAAVGTVTDERTSDE
jgi:hypothetical protein